MKKQSFTNLIELAEAANNSYQNSKLLNFLDNGKWQNVSIKDFYQNIKILTLALKEAGLHKSKTLAILANSSPTWLMMNYATMANGAICVPIFTNISSKNLIFEVNDAKIEYFFCDCQENLKILLSNNINYQKIIVFGFDADEFFSKNSEISSKYNKNIINFSDLLEVGKKMHQKLPNSYQNITKNIKKDDIATIIYTSGSTGTPKGVEITHNNLISQIKSAGKFFPIKNNQDIALSFLPMAHVFENMVVNYYLSQGISIYFADDVKNLGKLLKEIKPTLITVVPRVLEKTYNKMADKLADSSFFSKFIGNLAFNSALNQDPNKGNFFLKSTFNKLVYKKLTLALGGNLKMMICGGAPLGKNLEQFFRNIGINLYIGYGLTETSPVIAANSQKYNKTATVGKAFPDVKVKIKDGELLAKGPNIMKGYHNNLQKTKEIIDKDGWLKTGDLAEIDKDNFIKITGRKKELFKTSTGKYVSPVPIEQVILRNCTFLTAALVVAEGKKFVSCLLFPDFENLTNSKKKYKMTHLSDKDFLEKSLIQEIIKQVINKTNKDLNSYEQIKKFQLILDKISIENESLTPSMKLKRGILETRYKDIIDVFYKP